MAVQAPSVIAGAFLRCIGIDLTADGVNLPCQVSGGTLVGALEGKVFNKMGCAVFCGTLVTPNKALLAKRILLCSLFAGKETG